MDLISIISIIAKGLLGAFFKGYFLLPAYVLFIFLIKKQYERFEGVIEPSFDASGKPIKQKVEETIFYGLVAGFAGSLISVALGITLETKVFQYLYTVMLLMMFINIRFVCISYASAFLIAGALIFKLPDVNIPSLIALAGIVHLMESVLVWFNSGKDSLPVFVRHNGGIAGAFVTQKFWPVPIVFFTIMLQGAGTAGNLTGLPLWNFFVPTVAAGISGFLSDCGVSIATYSNFTLTKTPERKSRETAIQMLIYSLLLFVCAFLAIHIFAFRIVSIFILIGLHEGITLIGRFKEMHGTPIYLPAEAGIKVLEVLPGSHAEQMGIKRGDTILAVNGNAVRTTAGISAVVDSYPSLVWISVKGPEGTERTCESRLYPKGISDFGIIIVPRETEVTYTISSFESLEVVKNLVARFKGFGGKSF